MLAGDTPLDEIARRYAPLIEQGQGEMLQAAGRAADETALPVVVEKFVDMRYQGQSYELTIPFSQELLRDFHQAHQDAYGYSRPEDDVELVTLRVRVRRKVTPPALAAQPLAGEEPTQAFLGLRKALVSEAEGLTPVPFYRGEDLRAGNRLHGPAIVVRKDTTIWLGAADLGRVDGYGNLWIQVCA